MRTNMIRRLMTLGGVAVVGLRGSRDSALFVYLVHSSLLAAHERMCMDRRRVACQNMDRRRVTCQNHPAHHNQRVGSKAAGQLVAVCVHSKETTHCNET